MKWQLTVHEEDLDRFLKSFISHSPRMMVHDWLLNMGLGWKSYWEIPLDARPYLVRALVWAEVFPTKEAVFEIITKEKRLKARSQLIRFQDTWWMNGPEMRKIMQETYAMLTQDQFIRLAKLYPGQLLEDGPREYLPLAMAVPKLQNKYCRDIVANRLREETPKV